MLRSKIFTDTKYGEAEIASLFLRAGRRPLTLFPDNRVTKSTKESSRGVTNSHSIDLELPMNGGCNATISILMRVCLYLPRLSVFQQTLEKTFDPCSLNHISGLDCVM